MTRKSILVVLFVFSVAVSNTTVAQQFELLFFDDFNTENSGIGQLDYSSFTNWKVVSGSVDLIGAGTAFDFLPGNGLYVDLDGTGNKAGTLESNPISTVGGDHIVQFFLAGSQRGLDNDFVEVFFNELSLARLELPSTQPFVLYSFNVFVPPGNTPTLRFEHTGNDNIGLLLDRVSVLRELPFTGCLIEPESSTANVGSTFEFVVRPVREDRSVEHPASTIESVEIISGPNIGAQITRIRGTAFQYQGFPLPGDDTDIIRATVQIDGDRYTCDATVKWGEFAPVCLAGDDLFGRRHLVTISEGAGLGANWIGCDGGASIEFQGSYRITRQGKILDWFGISGGSRRNSHWLTVSDFEGSQPTRAQIIFDHSILGLVSERSIVIEDDNRPCTCNQ